jgi:hypothetical protein
MAAEAMLPGLGWGFIENMYNEINGIKIIPVVKSDFQDTVKNVSAYILTDETWMEHIINKAATNNISVDSMLTFDAIWQVQQEGKK